MIYFAQTETGSIKIGTTENLDARLRQHLPRLGELAILKTIPGGYEEETSIHRQFQHLRLSGCEEFRPGADLMEFIGKPLLVGANPEAVEKAEQSKFIRLQLPLEDHRKLRRLAADADTNMALLARRVMMEYIAKHPLKGGAN